MKENIWINFANFETKTKRLIDWLLVFSEFFNILCENNLLIEVETCELQVVYAFKIYGDGPFIFVDEKKDYNTVLYSVQCFTYYLRFNWR
jgi:hypothetical protein